MRAGDVIDGRFQIRHAVAKGGMGQIYRAEDRLSGEAVALKVIAWEGEATALERFQREAAALAALRHPGLVRYIAHGTHQRTPYLAMEWLEGEDLGAVLGRQRIGGERRWSEERAAAVTLASGGSATARASGPLPAASPISVPELVTVGLRVASALSELHRMQIIHRDLKPSNIFLVGGAPEQAKVVDLGVLHTRGQDQRLTGTGALVGTPSYMAPEQARGAPDLTPAVDIWALGCVLYECAAGVPPFRAGHPLAILARILVEDPLPLEQLCPDIPRPLASLIGRMLDKDPLRRPASAADIAEALLALRESTAPTPRVPVEPPPPLRAPSSSRRPRPAAPPPRLQRESGERRRGDDDDSTLRSAEYDEDPDDSGRPSGLTSNEARVLSLLFARRVPGCGATLEELEAAARRHGGQLHGLADGQGSFLVMLDTGQAPKEQATAAIRVAMALQHRAGGLPIAVVTGRGQPQGPVPVGDVVDHAVQMLAATPPGAVATDALTAALLEARFDLAQHGETYRLIGERQTEQSRTLLGKPTPWVGRRRELSLLMNTFEECIEESVARTVLVTGPAGLGKTRLQQEFVKAVRKAHPNVTVLHGQGDSLSAGSPFVMIAPAIRRSAKILDGEPPLVCRNKLIERLSASCDPRQAERDAPFIAELIGTPYDVEGHEALRAAREDPILLNDLMRAAWERWLQAEAGRGAVLLVLEDLHWGDLPSVQFVDSALRALATRPFMVLALARPEVHLTFPTLWAQREVEQLRLHGLSQRASLQLVRHALGDDVDAELAATLVERAGGNAFFLEELIRAVADGAPESLPSTVVGMVQSRLASIDPEARRLLRAASVFGEVFWEGGVRHLVGLDQTTFNVQEWLAELTERELLVKAPTSRIPDQVEFRFRHALVRDAAYEMLTHEDRVLGHALAGAWLEHCGERDALVLAEHYSRGQEPERAIKWFRRAADQALEGNDLQAAIERAERAIAAGASGVALGALRGLQANAAYWQGHYETAAASGDAATSLLPSGGGDWFKALGTALVSAARLGDYAEVDRRFEQALQTPPASGAEGAQLVCLCRGTFQLIFNGRFDEADVVLGRIDEIAGAIAALEAPVSAQVHHVRGLRAAHVGDVPRFLEHLLDAVAAFERAGDARNVCLEKTTVAWCHAELGDFEKAERLCRRNLSFCEELGAQQALTYGRVNLGYILTHRPGRLGEARELLSRAIADCRSVSNRRLEGWALSHLAALEHLAGDHSAELRASERAVERLAVSPGLQAWALASHARALLACDERAAALPFAERAMAILRRQGGLLQGESLPPLILAECLRALARQPQSSAAIRDARERLERRMQRLTRAGDRAAFAAIRDNHRTLELHRQWTEDV